MTYEVILMGTQRLHMRPPPRLLTPEVTHEAIYEAIPEVTHVGPYMGATPEVT